MTKWKQTDDLAWKRDEFGDWELETEVDGIKRALPGFGNKYIKKLLCIPLIGIVVLLIWKFVRKYL